MLQRFSRLLPLSLALVGAALLAIPSSRGQADPEPEFLGYSITDLGSLAPPEGGFKGWTRGLALDRGGSGAVVGRSFISGTHTHPFLWKNGVMTDLQPVGVQYASAAVAVHERANGPEVFVNPDLSLGMPVRWTQEGGFADMGGPAGAKHSVVAAVDDSGIAVGTAQFWDDSFDFRTERAWTGSGGTYSELPAPAVKEVWWTKANDIRNGFVAGQFNSDGYFPALWKLGENASARLLGNLGGTASIFGEATAVNASGHAAGYSGAADKPMHAFRHLGAVDGSLQDLGTLGGQTSQAWGMNDQDEVVGESQDAGGNYHGFVYRQGQMLDLNAVALNPGTNVIWTARAIDNQGRIVGWGTNGSRETGYLLTPVFRQVTPPGIFGLSPAQGARGTTIPVRLSGHGFKNGATADFGPGITVKNPIVRRPVEPRLDHILDVTLEIASDAPLGAREVTVTNSDGGKATSPTPFTVTEAPAPAALKSLSLPRRAVGGAKVTGTITLTGAAPAGGARVAFKSSNAKFPPPGAVTVPAGATRATFTYRTKKVNANTTYRVTASYAGKSKTVSLTLTRR